MGKASKSAATAIIGLVSLLLSPGCSGAGGAEVPRPQIRRRTGAYAAGHLDLATARGPGGGGCVPIAGSFLDDNASSSASGEAVWVEFTYDVETRQQNSLQERSGGLGTGIEAVEGLIHGVLSRGLLGCPEDRRDGGYVGSEEGRWMRGVSAVIAAPMDADVGPCAPSEERNRCRRVRGYAVIYLQDDRTKVLVHDTALHIIRGAMDGGMMDDRSIGKANLVRVRFVEDGDSDDGGDGRGRSGGDVSSSTLLRINGGNRDAFLPPQGGTAGRESIRKGRAYGYIFMAGVGMITLSVGFMLYQAYADAEQRAMARSATTVGEGGGGVVVGGKISPIASTTPTDEESMEVTLYVRSPEKEAGFVKVTPHLLQKGTKEKKKGGGWDELTSDTETNSTGSSGGRGEHDGRRE